MNGRVLAVLNQIVTYLTADPYFTDPDPTKVIAVYSQRTGDLQNELARTLNNAGIGVTVLLAAWSWEGEQIAKSLGLRFTIFVSENPTINATGKASEDVVENIIRILQWKPNGASNITNPMHRWSKLQMGNPAARLMAPTKDQPAILNHAMTVLTGVTLT